MPEFQMNGTESPAFSSLDAFTRAYIEAIFWIECEPSTTRDERDADRATWDKRVEEGQQKDMPGDYGFDDLAPETLALIIADCKAFQEANASMLQAAYDCTRTGLGNEGALYDEVHAGHDFWLDRNGHGVGFWDRGLGEIGGALSTACDALGYRDLVIGDDGLIYLM